MQINQDDGNERYAVMQVTGFIRTWPPVGLGHDPVQPESMEEIAANRGHTNYALVAVARLQVCTRKL